MSKSVAICMETWW